MAKLIAPALAALLLALPANADAPREVNVTSDSVPGWIPTVEQEAAAGRTARAYLAAEDSGDAAAAYKYFSDLQKKDVPFDDYRADVTREHVHLGDALERRFVKVTWTKDTPDAPMPGVYAAIDLASRFANADRHCGYLILYQPDSGGDFRVMREEANILDNATAAGIARKDGQAGLDDTWAKVSANCPNYPAIAPKL